MLLVAHLQNRSSSFVEFVAKYKIPIIFLSMLAAVTGLLVALYFALKRDIFACHGSKSDEEEGFIQNDCLLKHDDRTEKREEKLESLDEFFGNDGDDFCVDDIICREPEDCISHEGAMNHENTELVSLSSPKQQKALPAHGGSIPQFIEEDFSREDLLSLPEAKVTTSLFLASEPRRSSPFKKILEKINRPRKKHRSGVDKQSLCRAEGAAISSSTLDSSLWYLPDERSQNSLLGRLQVSVQYDKEEMELAIGVRQGTALTLDGDDTLYWQVCVAILPHRKHRFKTKYKKTSTPVFKESFTVKDIPMQIVEQLGVRFRIYGKLGKTGMRRFYGEFVMDLDCIEDLEEKFVCWYDVHSKKERNSTISDFS